MEICDSSLLEKARTLGSWQDQSMQLVIEDKVQVRGYLGLIGKVKLAQNTTSREVKQCIPQRFFSRIGPHRLLLNKKAVWKRMILWNGGLLHGRS